MEVTFLGTGTSQGIPVIGSKHPVCLSTDPKDKRLRVSALVEWEGFNILIDCGPDFRSQMLTNQISHIDAILYTHEHNDHTAGLDDIRPYFSGRVIFPSSPIKGCWIRSGNDLGIFWKTKTNIRERQAWPLMKL